STDWILMRVFVPGCTSGIPVETSSDLPPRIDLLVTAAACPSIPGYPEIDGPTLLYWNFNPRPAGDYRITVRLQDGARVITLSERRVVIHDYVPDVEVQP